MPNSSPLVSAKYSSDVCSRTIMLTAEMGIECLVEF